MNNFKKITAVLLAALLVICTAGCSTSPSWSYKSENATYADGVYIYSLYSAYNQAYSVLQESLGEDFDAEASILDIKSTFDETGEEMLCEDWILEQADIITKNLAALDEEIAKNGITLDQTQVESARELAREDWYLGPYYEYYVASGYEAVSYESMLAPHGVSFDSFFTSSYLASVKQSAVFDYIYGKGGEQEVSDEEITEYFVDNYTSYAYFTKNLYETTLDETTGQQTYLGYSDELIKSTKDALETYVDLFNSGTAYTEVMNQYMKANSLTADPTVRSTENLDSSALGEEVLEALKKLDEGKATCIQVGDGDTAVLYYIAKFDIEDESEDYLAADGNRDTLLQNMKSEEFFDFLDEITESVEVEINTEAVSKYTPAIFEENL